MKKNNCVYEASNVEVCVKNMHFNDPLLENWPDIKSEAFKSGTNYKLSKEIAFKFE